MELDNCIVNAEGPNQHLSSFKGSIVFKETRVPLSTHNFLLRGCILRNTDYVLGCVVYSG
jgi:hypothetical protein